MKMLAAVFCQILLQLQIANAFPTSDSNKAFDTFKERFFLAYARLNPDMLQGQDIIIMIVC